MDVKERARYEGCGVAFALRVDSRGFVIGRDSLINPDDDER